MDRTALPRHIAVIMDGNGRWAKNQGLERTAGHKKGAEVFRAICEYATKIGIEYMTFYAFSTENWRRSEKEVDAIMNLLRDYLFEMQEREAENEKAGYNIHFIGSRERLPEDIVAMMDFVEERSKSQNKIHINIAVNYGGRDEIVRAAKALASDVGEGKLCADDITEEMLSKRLYTEAQPDPDLLIRTGGEFRLSNFLLWQCAYAEFYSTKVLWPDFDEGELDKAIEAFSGRERRFGGV